MSDNGCSLTGIESKLIVALDVDSLCSCENLLQKLDPSLCRVKIGKELFTACGPQSIELAHRMGFEVFLDLKFHDIPVTVAKAVRAAAELGVWMVNVHASGGRRMMEAAVEAISDLPQQPYLIAVTVLTSMSASDFQEVGMVRSLEEHVLHLATLAKESGLDGVVCSAQEAYSLKSKLGKDFLLITPGIRPEGSDLNDQRRALTPVQAVENGSDYLVIGRPITQAEFPSDVCKAVFNSLGSLSSV